MAYSVSMKAPGSMTHISNDELILSVIERVLRDASKGANKLSSAADHLLQMNFAQEIVYQRLYLEKAHQGSIYVARSPEILEAVDSFAVALRLFDVW